ncbi:retrovirus-related pol polyprotein from transposon TNT 1-94 [Tanacetum coccineum]
MKILLATTMLLLARSITQNFSNPINNRLRTSSNTINQAIIQGDRVNILSRNSGNTGRNTRRAFVQEEVVEGSNAQNESENVQRTLRTSSSGNNSTIQCYNHNGKGHYARNCPKPRVRDSKYFMEQMLLAKQDEAGVIFTDEQKSFSLCVCLQGMEEIENLLQTYSKMAQDPTCHKTLMLGQAMILHLLVSTIGDDQIDSNIIFNEPNRNVNSGSVEKDTHVPDRYALEQLLGNRFDDEESIHEDASDTGATPKQKQQVIPQTTTAISNIKLPILKKEEYDIWAMEMEHY